MSIKLLTLMVMPLSQVLWLILISWFIRSTFIARMLRGFALFLLVVWSLPLVSERMKFLLEDQIVSGVTTNERGEVVVVLGGMLTPPAWPDRQPDLQASIDRAWQAARLIKEGRIKQILLAGGRQSSDSHSIQPESEVVRGLLIDWGVPANAISIETESRNTQENAESMAKRLKGTRPWLITSGWHMPRALAEFKCVGLAVTPYPVEVSQYATPWSRALLPSAEALAQSTQMLKEWLGLAVVYWRCVGSRP